MVAATYLVAFGESSFGSDTVIFFNVIIHVEMSFICLILNLYLYYIDVYIHYSNVHVNLNEICLKIVYNLLFFRAKKQEEKEHRVKKIRNEHIKGMLNYGVNLSGYIKLIPRLVHA